MAIVKKAEYRGNMMTSTLSGNISLNEGTGELVVRNGANVLTRVNSQGFIYAEASGLRRILLGAHLSDNHIGEWITKANIDVINELSS